MEAKWKQNGSAQNRIWQLSDRWGWYFPLTLNEKKHWLRQPREWNSSQNISLNRLWMLSAIEPTVPVPHLYDLGPNQQKLVFTGIVGRLSDTNGSVHLVFSRSPKKDSPDISRPLQKALHSRSILPSSEATIARRRSRFWLFQRRCQRAHE
jgi:hypothetical protein